MMFFTDLVQLTRRMGRHVPSYDGKATKNELAALLNRALRTGGKALEILDPRVQMKLTGTRLDYNLMNGKDATRKVWRPTRAWVGGRQMVDVQGKPRLVSPTEMNNAYPNWRETALGVPTMMAHQGSGKVYLDKVPTLSVLAAGGHYVEGLILPGVVTETGEYLANGFPTSTTEEGASAGIESATATPGTARLVGLGGTVGPWAGAGNIGADDNTEGVFEWSSLGAELLDVVNYTGSQGLLFSNFGLTIPEGATVSGVKIKSLKARSTEDCVFTMYWRANVDSGGNVATQTVTVEGNVEKEYGPLGSVSGFSAEQVMSPNFGFYMPIAGTGEVIADFTVSIDFVQIEVMWTLDGAAGSAVGTSEAVRDAMTMDVPEDLHEGLVYLALVMGAEPGIGDEAQLARLTKFDQRWREALAEARAENRRAISPADGYVESVWEDTYPSR